MLSGRPAGLQRHLIEEYGRPRRSVLIIDEAQNLAIGTLEELRMFSNINADKDQLLQLVLAGQPQLKALLHRPELEQFAQRVSSDFHLEPLTPPEVKEYVQHRLSVVGREAPLFDDRAMYLIFKISGGIPRKVNLLRDTALVYGFSQDARIITAELVSRCCATRPSMVSCRPRRKIPWAMHRPNPTRIVKWVA